MSNDASRVELPKLEPPRNLHDESRTTLSPDKRVVAHPGAQQTVIRIDASALSIIALLLATAAFVIVLMQSVYSPQIVDAKIAAGIAKSAEEAHAANVKAQLTERDLTIVREALQKKGIDLPPKD